MIFAARVEAHGKHILFVVLAVWCLKSYRFNSSVMNVRKSKVMQGFAQTVLWSFCPLGSASVTPQFFG